MRAWERECVLLHDFKYRIQADEQRYDAEYKIEKYNKETEELKRKHAELKGKFRKRDFFLSIEIDMRGEQSDEMMFFQTEPWLIFIFVAKMKKPALKRIRMTPEEMMSTLLAAK